MKAGGQKKQRDRHLTSVSGGLVVRGELLFVMKPAGTSHALFGPSPAGKVARE